MSIGLFAERKSMNIERKISSRLLLFSFLFRPLFGYVNACKEMLMPFFKLSKIKNKGHSEKIKRKEGRIKFLLLVVV